MATKKTVAKKIAPKKAAPSKKAVKPTAKKTATPAKKAVSKKTVKAKPAPKALPVKKTVKPAAKQVKVTKPVPTKVVKNEIQKKHSTPVSKKNQEIKIPEVKPVAKATPAKSVKPEPVKEVKVPKTTMKTSVPYQPGYTPLEKRADAIKPNEPLVRYSDADLAEFNDIRAAGKRREFSVRSRAAPAQATSAVSTRRNSCPSRRGARREACDPCSSLAPISPSVHYRFPGPTGWPRSTQPAWKSPGPCRCDR